MNRKTISIGPILKFLSPLLLLFAFSTFLYFKVLTFQGEQITEMSEGLSICFNRITQTFLAPFSPLGVKNSALTKTFLSSTQECLGDLLQLVEENALVSSSLQGKINKLSLESFDFNKQMLSIVSQFTTKESSISKNSTSYNPMVNELPNTNDPSHPIQVKGVSEQTSLTGNQSGIWNDLSEERRVDLYKYYSNLEDQKIKAQDVLDSAKKANTSKISLFEKFFYISFLFWGLLPLISLIQNFKKSYINQKLEERAKSELQNGKNYHFGNTDELVKQGLEFNGLYHTSKLLTSYHNYLLDHALIDSKSDSNEANVVHQEEEAFKEPPLHLPPNPPLPQQHLSDDEYLSLSKVTGHIVQLFSKKLFSNGIIFKIEIDDQLVIRGVEDSVQKVFYHLLLESVQNFSSAEIVGDKKISLQSRIVGDAVLIEFLDNGPSSSQISSVNNKDNYGLQYCQSTMKENGGSLIIEDLKEAQQGKPRVRFTLFFKKASDKITAALKSNSPRLVDVKKGKKRDLIKIFKDQDSSEQ